MGSSPLPSRGPKSGRKLYITPTFSGIPKQKGEQNQKWLPHPCFLGGPKEGRNATPSLHSRRSPNTEGDKVRIVCLTLAFSGAHKWAEMLDHPCILQDYQQRGTKSEVGTPSLPSRGPKRGQKCYITPPFSAIPKHKGGQNQKWLPHPYLTGSRQVSGNATAPLHSRGSPNKGGQNQKWLPHPCLLRGPKEGRNATPPLHSRRSPNTKGENQNWLPHRCLLQGPPKGGIATSSLHCLGFPNKGG